MVVKRWLCAAIGSLFVVGLPARHSVAADLVPTQTYAAPVPRTVVAPLPLPRNSIFVFAGKLASGSMGDTAMFNLAADNERFENSIVGAAYQRDVWRWRGFVVGAEIGVADRFGPYKVCCSNIVRSSIVHSGELWGGIVLRHDGVLLFNTVRFSAGGVAGLSATTNSIGSEREREISKPGNARLLFYLGPEIAIAHVAAPDLELVARLHHRSGANGTLGNLMEGYNAWVFGARWRF